MGHTWIFQAGLPGMLHASHVVSLKRAMHQLSLFVDCVFLFVHSRLTQQHDSLAHDEWETNIHICIVGNRNAAAAMMVMATILLRHCHPNDNSKTLPEPPTEKNGIFHRNNLRIIYLWWTNKSSQKKTNILHIYTWWYWNIFIARPHEMAMES